MSWGRIINLRDWKNNKSGGWKEIDRKRERKEHFVLKIRGFYAVFLSPGCFLIYIVLNDAFINFELWNYY
jgi:hypothetical protein